MKTITKIKTTILFAILSVIISCAKRPEFVAVENIAILNSKNDTLMVGMDYIVYNPNNVRTKLRQSSMEIYYRDSLVGRGFLKEQIVLSANDTIGIPVSCKISLKSLSTFYPELLTSEASTFDLKGNGKVSFMLNSFSIVLDEQIDLNTKEAILTQIEQNLDYGKNFKLRSISSNKLPSLRKTQLRLEMEAVNRMPIAYQIDSLELGFYLDKTKESVAHWTLEKPYDQRPMGSQIIPLQVTLNNLDLLKQMKFSWLTDQKVNFTILGEAQVLIEGYRFNVPIEDLLEISF
ncbi:LEA type 2 family protein [Flagellimonas meridianipacifica]|uniref:Late embryogenesis abundant protein LEA-2 subgroup domain-containing protein n=1 Tax=Flagellimonas meridianipacifica TaxID=1080225 RepID=A0A2T0MBU1_9FLAO|nr:LEA type 2 family protein [Allomuricauda pacifica]PRX54963.1 hypothetical protein CLV81_3368 [Allomuricauda pacifica]